ncbi:MAG: AAA family ATPase [Colwellia sp.]
MQLLVNTILAKVESVVLGKPHECRLALACLLAQGHLLIEDLPGMGKTTLAHTLAKTLGLSYQRSQFTSDLLPADVIGVSIFNTDTKTFELHQGPIFNQVVLADEINRASPKTQSALLEAMAERQVSIDGVTYDLPTPFFVIATQNPLFHAGTYPLPESQLDRFMMRISLGFPDVKAEKQILLSTENIRVGNISTDNVSTKGDNENTPTNHPSTKLINETQFLAMQSAVQQVSVSNEIIEYIIALCHVSRGQQKTHTIEQAISCKPLSPRAGKALLLAAKAWAFIDNRDFLLPDDVQAVFSAVCQHRLEINAHDVNASNAVAKQILNSVDVLTPLAH